VNVALVGCGNIAAQYARSIADEPRLTLVGVTDVAPERASELARQFDVAHHGSLAELLADDRVETVVNLTVPQAHATVTATCLEAGRHVHTEKPVALAYDEAKALAELAKHRGVRLSCAPATLLGEAQQTAWKLVRDGALGEVRVCYAEANWGRIESWHPSPETLYEAGPVVDVGIYPLTILTGMFGPVRTVRAYGATIQPERVRRDGGVFRLSTPDFTVAALELESGVVVRLTATFWVGPGKQRGIEFHGHESSLYLASWAEFDSRLEHSIDGESYTAVPLVREPYRGIDWSRALVELVDAVARGRPHRAGAEHAAHVVEVLEAIAAAAASGGAVAVASSFPPPQPLEWAAAAGRQ
jgi:predicted dehydrogenase